MANFPGGAGAAPGIYDIIQTNTNAASINSGTRTAVIVGEGSRVDRLVNSAVGGGNDGLDPTYSSTNGSDGRHFLLTVAPVISNRTTLLKNSIPLVGIEESITSSFSSLYDYQLDITNGQIQLQTAALVDQGGAYYVASSANVGNGKINGLTLVDVNAPTETWNIRCASILRDGYGNPVDGYAKFTAVGSVSGNVLDGYGNIISWQSNGITNTNNILSFSITEGLTAFQEGDRFTVLVKSGALSRGDSLVAQYIGVGDINDPEFFTDLDLLQAKHGAASTTNRLSLGAQLAWANGTPGVWACEAAPSIPRRVSYILRDSASGNATSDDLEFPLPIGVVPDENININFFVTNPITGIETQILPNKVAFYNPTYTLSPGAFESAITYQYSYTVIMNPLYEEITQSNDGVLTVVSAGVAQFSSVSYTFGIIDVTNARYIKILSPNNNAGTYPVVSVSGGVATIHTLGTFHAGTAINFEILDEQASGAEVLFTKDLALSAGSKLRATVVDTKDSSFFDPNWENALQALEAIDVDIVVPLPSQTISAIFAAANIHCNTMSDIQNRHERILFIGAINGLTPDNVAGAKPAAVEDIGVLEGIQGDTVSDILAGNIEDLADYNVQNSYGSTFRVVYFYPDQIVVNIAGTNTIMDGFFMAPAAAGYLSGVPNVALPITNKVLAGFTILRNRLYRPIIVRQIIGAGMTLVQPAAGGGLVIWGKTTTNSGFVEEEELSVVFIRDAIAKTMRRSFAGFPGGTADQTTLGSTMAKAHDVLTSFIAQGLIQNFTNLKVVVDSVDPRQFNITAQVLPIYPLNWIFISIGIGTTTG